MAISKDEGTNRRSVLGILGLAPAGLMATGAETFAASPEQGEVLALGNACRSENIARALRNLADNVESGGVMVEQIDVNSSARHDEILRTHLSVSFFVDESKVVT